MPLIFLDTPQIHLLERTRENDPHRYASFQAGWCERGCSLVFTITQASEIRRYPDSDRRQGRYRVLAELTPLRTDMPLPPDGAIRPRTLTEREILRAMYDRCPEGAFSAAVEDRLAQWMDILPDHVPAESAALLQAIEDEAFLDLINLTYEASTHAAEAAKLRARNKRNATRVRDLQTAPLSLDEALKLKAAFTEQFASLAKEHALSSPKIVFGEAGSGNEERAYGFIDRIQEIGHRAALLEALSVTGLEGGTLQKLTSNDLVDLWFFQYQVRKFAGEVLGLDDEGQERLIGMLCLTDCPGSWLQLKLGRRIERGCVEPRANHFHDAERLAYLPYVDLLLTDAEMVEYVRQIRNDEATPARIKNVRPPLSIPNSITALEEAIRSVESYPS